MSDCCNLSKLPTPAVPGPAILTQDLFDLASYVNTSSGLTASVQLHAVRTSTIGCSAGVPYSQRETITYNMTTGMATGTVIDWVNSAGTVSSTMPAGFTLGSCAEVSTTAYAEVYRLAWDETIPATATTGANTPAGAAIGVAGNTVTISGPVHSLTWKWLPATTPVPDALNPPDILDPVVTVNGLAYVAAVPNPLFSQQFSQTIESPHGVVIGDWVFTVNNGAFIEITVIKAV